MSFQLSEEKSENNCIKFDLDMYGVTTCPHWTAERSNIMNIEIGKINFYYIHEQFLRFLDYFMDKFIWAVTDTNPYLRK